MNERTIYQQLTELENLLESEVAGWERCAKYALNADNQPLSLRNSIRARTTQHCLDELRKVTKPASLMVRLYNQGYHAGHEDTVEACFTPIHHTDMDTYHADVVAEILQENCAKPTTQP